MIGMTTANDYDTIRWEKHEVIFCNKLTIRTGCI